MFLDSVFQIWGQFLFLINFYVLQYLKETFVIFWAFLIMLSVNSFRMAKALLCSISVYDGYLMMNLFLLLTICSFISTGSLVLSVTLLTSPQKATY